MRALSDDYDAPSPPSEDAVVVLGARLDEEPLSVEQEILMSLAIIELALGVLVVLGVLFACAYVAGFRKRRLPELAPARLALAWLAALWLLGLLLSRGCTWWLVDRVTYELAPSPDASPDRGPPPQAGEQAPLSDGHHDLMCTLHTCFTVGFVEPSLLLLVLGVVRSKTAAAPPPRWRVAAMLRRALLCALPFAILQVVFVLLPLFGLWSNEFVEPQPQPPAPTNRTAGGGKGAGGAESDDAPQRTWWHAEGCAATYASAITTAAFVVPFEGAWALACYRLSTLVLNARLRQRLYVLQLAFTLSPALLVLLRFSRLVLPHSWRVVPWLLADAELLVALLACYVAARSLVWRPVREAPPDSGAGRASGSGTRDTPTTVPLRNLGAGEVQLLVQTISPPRRGSADRRASAPAAAAAAPATAAPPRLDKVLEAKSSEERERERSRGASSFGERRTVPGGDRMTSACPSFATAQAPAPAIETHRI